MVCFSSSLFSLHVVGDCDVYPRCVRGCLPELFCFLTFLVLIFRIHNYMLLVHVGSSAAGEGASYNGSRGLLSSFNIFFLLHFSHVINLLCYIT